MATICNTDDVIDSRDIIERIAELEAEQADLMDGHTVLEDLSAEQRKALLDWEAENAEELDTLRKVAAEGESSPDWSYGEQLIRDDYFVEHTEQFIDDCYEMPKALNSGEWPYRHMKIDYEAAADGLKQDYFDINFGGVTYWIRG